MSALLIRGASALLAGILVATAPAGVLNGAESSGLTGQPADIELRKSFGSTRRAAREVPPPENGGDHAGARDGAAQPAPRPIEAVADALGERLQSDGTLHLPNVGGGDLVLEGATTPILGTVAGRHLIIDRERTILPGVVDEIARRWPAFLVVQPPAGADLRSLIGSVLDVSGYDAVLRGTPLIIGRGVTFRFTPDFVVLRSEQDLLSGETRTISIVDDADVLPAELRELAGDHRVRTVELTPEGAPSGASQAAWRDPAGRVTTMETDRLASIIEEIAITLGFSVERRVPLPDLGGAPTVSADLRITKEEAGVMVCENAAPQLRKVLLQRTDAPILLDAAADLQEAIGALLKHLKVPAIGPTVEFHRPSTPAAASRFVITVPGWLVESEGRRIMITGAAPPPLVRLFLTREGIDIFEYRVRRGR